MSLTRGRNHFDLLRLLLALTVVLIHGAQLSGLPGLSWVPVWPSTAAVNAFFVSGDTYFFSLRLCLLSRFR